MAVKERQGQIGTYSEQVSKPKWYGAPGTEMVNGDYTGSLLDFNVLYKGQNVTGTYNPTQGGGSVDLIQDQSFINSSKDLLSQDENFALASAKNAVSRNTDTNPFFSEFFNYYLGLAQERQANLQKSISKGDLLAGSGQAASMIGGSLL